MNKETLIPEWIINYDNANYKSSAGRAVRFLLDAVKQTDTMKSRMHDRINEILAEERMGYPSATIFENAPLALIQYGMEVELHSLQKALDIPLTEIASLRGGKKQPN